MLYYYKYVLRLKRRDKPAPLQLGILLHDYLSNYYALIAEAPQGDPAEAHVEAQNRVQAEHEPKIKAMAGVALGAGANEAAMLLRDMLPKVMRITDRYYYTRGHADANEHEILLNEVAIEEELEHGIVSKGRIDLVTLHRPTGRTYLWEHKSTTRVPDMTMRLFDLQTPVYADQLDVEIDAVVWNYLLTKEPTKPVLTQKRMLSRAKIDTTWQVTLDAIKEYGLNPAHYEHMREELEPKERQHFFPRHVQVIVADLIVNDYIIAAYEIERQERRWAAGVLQPLRSLSRDCAWCEMLMLCKTALTGGSEEDMIALRYYQTKEEPPPVEEEA